MSGDWCEKFKEILDRIPQDLDNAKEHCFQALAIPDEHGVIRDKMGVDVTRESREMMEKTFRSVIDAITKVKNYIKSDVLPWAMAPVALEDSSARYNKIERRLAQEAKFTAGTSNECWGDPVGWVGSGADRYQNSATSVMQIQRSAIDASIKMAESLSKILEKVSQKQLTFLVDSIGKLAELLGELATKFIGAGGFMAGFRLIFSLENVVNNINSILVSVTKEYGKLCVESLASAKELSRSANTGYELGGTGWPRIPNISESMPGKRSWDEKQG